MFGYGVFLVYFLSVSKHLSKYINVTSKVKIFSIFTVRRRHRPGIKMTLMTQNILDISHMQLIIVFILLFALYSLKHDT